MTNAGLVIVGAGHAGVSAALAARDAGYAGKITMVADDGVDQPYERPPLSKWSEDGAVTKPIVAPEQLAAADIDRISSRITALNPSTKQLVLQNGENLPFSRLLLATGASARRLSLEVGEGANVFYLRDKADAEALYQASQTAKTAVVIGAGFIGLELAASLRKSGLSVQVVEVSDRLLARAVSAPVAEIVRELHIANGVEFLFGAQIESIKASGTDSIAALDDGSKLRADIIIAGVGSAANTSLAQDAGLSVDDGIVVNTHLQTNHPDIYAAGDCCRFPLYGKEDRLMRLESWQAAREQGALAGRNMVNVGGDLEICQLTPWFWSEQYDHVLQVAGIQVQTASMSERHYADDHHVTFGLSPDGMLDFACGIAPGTKIAKDIRFSIKLMEAQCFVSASQLVDQNVAIKSLIQRI